MEKKIDCVTVGDLETNCWLYAYEDNPVPGGPRRCALIDPGDAAALIVSRLGELNWIPGAILLTHGHFDHLAALPDLLAAFSGGGPWSGSPVPKIGICRQDADCLGPGALAVHRNSFAAAGGNPDYVDALWKPLPGADLLFDEGDRAASFTVLRLPGHTPGSAAFYDEEAGVLFSGDTLFRGTWGRTDLPGGNWAEMRQSLARLFSMKETVAVCPGHGAPTTIGEEAANLLPEI